MAEGRPEASDSAELVEGSSTCLMAEGGPNGVSNFDVANSQNTLLYLRIEALSYHVLWQAEFHALLDQGFLQH